MPAIYHEGSWLGNATDPEVLVKDTVGWTGKNRAYSQTNNAVIAHIENGITYDVSWTGSATVTLKKNSASGATITSGSTSPLSFTADVDYELYFGSSATVTNIMVKDSRITDPTYEPYHESVEVMYEEEIHGVNLLEVTASTQTINGVTFTVNADKSVTVNGTATADANFFLNPSMSYTTKRSLVMTGCPDNSVGQARITLRINSNGTQYFLTSDKEVVVPAGLIENPRIVIANGITVNNLTFKPMLRKAEIDDPTYRPYNPQAIQNQLNAQGVLGAKNLLQNKATTQTINGVTFTVNADKSVTVNGTATAQAIFWLTSNVASERMSFDFPVILSGMPSGGSNTTFAFGGNNVGICTEPTEYPANTSLSVAIVVYSGYTANNLIFRPMIRLASDPDDTYQPYAMTNRELTEEKINIADLKTVVSASSDFADFKTRIASL